MGNTSNLELSYLLTNTGGAAGLLAGPLAYKLNKMKKGNIIEYKGWTYKIVNSRGSTIHVRPTNGSGKRVRMFSPTISLIFKDGAFSENGLIVTRLNMTTPVSAILSNN